MLNCQHTDSFVARLTAGLVVTLMIVVGSLTQATANIQAFF